MDLGNLIISLIYLIAGNKQNPIGHVGKIEQIYYCVLYLTQNNKMCPDTEILLNLFSVQLYSV